MACYDMLLSHTVYSHTCGEQLCSTSFGLEEIREQIDGNLDSSLETGCVPNPEVI